MSFAPDLPVDVYVCFGVERGTKFPHWMLMLRSRDSARGTWYHSVGGPSQNRPYEVEISGNKRVNSNGIQSISQLGTISPNDVNKVKAAAKRIPAQQCQRYIVALVAELETRGLLPIGGAAMLDQEVRIGTAAAAYLQANPVPRPTFLTAPSAPRSRSSSPGRAIAGPSSERRSRSPSPYGGSSTHGIDSSSYPTRYDMPHTTNPNANMQPSSGGHSNQAATTHQQPPRKKESSCCCIIM